MNKKLKVAMTFNRKDKKVLPLIVFEVNGSYILGVYQGTLSDFDILIRYRQKVDGVWSRIRTPRHIHWAVDILIKLYEDKEKTQEFLNFLLEVWAKTVSIRSRKQQQNVLALESLFNDCQEKIKQYESLNDKGEYSVKYLILLAKLLMIQEKTNLETAYMFKNLLEALKKGGNIFSVVSAASHVGK